MKQSSVVGREGSRETRRTATNLQKPVAKDMKVYSLRCAYAATQIFAGGHRGVWFCELCWETRFPSFRPDNASPSVC